MDFFGLKILLIYLTQKSNRQISFSMLRSTEIQSSQGFYVLEEKEIKVWQTIYSEYRRPGKPTFTISNFRTITFKDFFSPWGESKMHEKYVCKQRYVYKFSFVMINFQFSIRYVFSFYLSRNEKRKLERW